MVAVNSQQSAQAKRCEQRGLSSLLAPLTKLCLCCIFKAALKVDDRRQLLVRRQRHLQRVHKRGKVG